ncbi:hypothetical protein [Pseudomonas azerbaijanorientalis]|uniref:hypothetical protein n=1 Tax=Pseudomonas azerbaijanorientalis TaxID=2842350 RepID=UPI001C3CEB2A|nr:hypothetical protein [Pseudomonas azerbaijanorientalis]QXH63914.1 hypothetical protein KSS91_10715 [Pseudomonas azerbaijanorientalis]
MPVRLDKVPALAARPARPRIWLWLGLLLLCLLLGVGGSLLFADQPLRQQTVDFWNWALGFPFLVWCALAFSRMLLHVGGQSAADGWDEAREEDMIRRIRQGRRSQQVLAANLYTSLQDPAAEPVSPLNALLSGTESAQAQSSHSRSFDDSDEDPEAVLLTVLTQGLADLAPILNQLPDDKPLALLLEVDCSLPPAQWRPAWHQAWRNSGIRQSTTPVEGSGLAAVDHWLDQRINDQALLLIMALQFTPQAPEGTAEVAVGLLLGNRLTQSTLAPIAYLHRPEQEREPTDADLLYATRQALDWVPLQAQAVERVWRAGIDAQRYAAINTVLAEVPLLINSSEGVCNLDALPGHPGVASPWLAIAAATQTIQRGAGPQFIFSGGGAATAGLWSTVLMPVSPLSI